MADQASAAAGSAASAAMGENSKSSGSGSSIGAGSSTGSSTGTSTGTSSTSSNFGTLAGWGGNYLNSQIQNPLNEYINMLNKAMTGGQLTGAGIPMAQAAIAQSRGAAAANLGSAENFLARSGGANSPFAGQLESSIAAQGNEATAQAPVDIYKTILGQIPGFLQGMQGTALSSILGAGGLNTTSSFANQSANQFANQFQSHDVHKDTSHQSGGLLGLF